MPSDWEFSSAGRASALQAEGQRFDPVNSHHSRKNRSRSVAVITSPCHGEDRGFDSRRNRFKLIDLKGNKRNRLVSSVGRAFDF